MKIWKKSAMVAAVVLSVAGISQAMAGEAVSSTSVPIQSQNLPGDAQARAKSFDTISQGRGRVDKEFDAGGGLIGMVVEPMVGAHKQIVYMTQDGSRMMSGVLVAPDRGVLSQQHSDLYIPKPDMTKFYAEAEKANYIEDGKNKNAPILYVVGEPSCHFCRDLHVAMAPLIEAGKVRVRWMMIGFNADGQRKSAWAMDQKSPSQALTEIYSGTAQFGSTSDASLQKIDQNQQLAARYEVGGTPFLLYRTKSGSIQTTPGAVTGQPLADLIATLG